MKSEPVSLIGADALTRALTSARPETVAWLFKFAKMEELALFACAPPSLACTVLNIATIKTRLISKVKTTRAFSLDMFNSPYVYFAWLMRAFRLG
jgi:hypothetical protein